MNDIELARAYDWQTDRILANLTEDQQAYANWYDEAERAYLNEKLNEFADDFFCFQETKEDRASIQALMNEFVKMIYTKNYDFARCIPLMQKLHSFSVETMEALIAQKQRNMPF